MRAILVVGCGRTGTSVTASMVQALGVEMCDHLIGPHPEFNPMGHFECREFWELSREVMDGQRDALTAEQEHRYRELVRSHMRPRWCVKDAGFGFVLPSVLRICREEGNDVSLVVTHRQFGPTVKSRITHSGLDAGRATILQLGERAALYGALYDAVETYGGEVPQLHLDYERTTDDPYGTATRLAAFVGVEDEVLIERAGRMVKPLLRHH